MLRYLMARTELSVLSLVVMTVSALVVELWIVDATDPLHGTNVYDGAQIHNALPLVFLSGVAGLLALGGLRSIGAAKGRLLAAVLFLEVLALG